MEEETEEVTLFVQDKKKLKLGESFRSFLPTIEWKAEKINQRGKRQPRTIRLASDGIYNVRKNNTAVFHPYHTVVRVGVVGKDKVVLQYDDKWSNTYISENAVLIAQEIMTRCHMQPLENDSASAMLSKNKTGAFQFGSIQRLIRDDSNVREHKGHSTFLQRIDYDQFGTGEEVSKMEDITRNMNDIEGKTLRSFVQNTLQVDVDPKLASNVRSFIDGIRKFILKNREDELENVLNTFVESDEYTDGLYYKIDGLSRNDANPDDEDDEAAKILRAKSHENLMNLMVGSALEKTVIPPLEQMILQSLKSSTLTVERSVAVSLSGMKTTSQAAMGIPDSCQSPSQWASAVKELNDIEVCVIPSEKIECILSTVEEIVRLYKEEHKEDIEKKGPESAFLSADELLPIFTYIVANSTLSYPVLSFRYLLEMSDPLISSGEAGYYVTIFASSVHQLISIESKGVEKPISDSSHKKSRITQPVKIILFHSISEGSASDIKCEKEVRYDVIRVRRNRKHRGVLRISDSGIDDFKRDKLSSSHSISDVKSLTLTSPSGLVLDFFNDHEVDYRSLDAVVASLEIMSRYNLSVNQSERCDRDFNMKISEFFGTFQSTVGSYSKTCASIPTFDFNRIGWYISGLLRNTQRAEGAICSQLLYNIDILERNKSTFCSNLRKIVDGMRTWILTKYRSVMLDLVPDRIKERSLVLHLSVGEAIERALLMPLERNINATVREKVDNDYEYMARLPKLENATMQSFGIDTELLSQSRYWQSVAMLAFLNTGGSPHEKFTALSHFLSTLDSSLRNELRIDLSELDVSKLIPVCSYALVSSKVKQPLLLLNGLLAMGDPDLFTGVVLKLIDLLECAVDNICSINLDGVTYEKVIDESDDEF